MQPTTILFLIVAYFGVLILFSYLSGRKNQENNDTFFKANKQSPWFLVAFGMIGASLSGVTFISVPGKVEASQFVYFQLVLGYILGYFVIGTVLLPLYYKMNLTSIYTYLGERFGNFSYKTGASFFILSRTVGSCLRLMLVADVLQTLVFDKLNIPYWITVSITIFLIWLYTFRSGIKTIIWTDTLQTLFMLIAVGVCIVVVSEDLGLNIANFSQFVADSEFSRTFFFDNPHSPDYFWKQFFSGAFIAIVMTGLDQDMMQKNLTCRNLKDAQKNMFWFTIVLTFVNLMFLVMGLLFTEYALKNGIDAHKDQLFPILANGHLGLVAAFCFILGLIAAAYSSADSALTSLTTSFSIDILEIEKKYEIAKQVSIRKKVHLMFVFISIFIILIFRYFIQDASVIDKVFLFAGFTYGPLLGMYSFGLFTPWKVNDKLVPIVALSSVGISILLMLNSMQWFGFAFGFEILMVNGFITFLGLLLIRNKAHSAIIS
ncbi:sodium:solute symporter [Imtechella halotolerans]|uniref:Transmembrane sodium-solute transporter n=1 Tax=Imtechella halotolerans K1 TaxID=946077 RepID=I0WGR7_9FLAO|nr:sodium:solute symporter [Imtechella halotolerans]EID75583.1 transmembrane sodium-solute transporter [Imtechella halotolerans K1]WMQ63589.1 sodium:solute symporter [Imtechella halotolerans]